MKNLGTYLANAKWFLDPTSSNKIRKIREYYEEHREELEMKWQKEVHSEFEMPLNFLELIEEKGLYVFVDENIEWKYGHLWSYPEEVILKLRVWGRPESQVGVLKLEGPRGWINLPWC